MSKSIGQTMGRAIVACVMVLLVNASFGQPAHAQDDAARKILKTMTDFMAGQKTFSVAFDSDIEVITTDLRKIQFTSSGHVHVARPNRIRATRTGGYQDVEVVFDGKTLTINDKGGNQYAQVEASGSIDEAFDVLLGKHGFVAPGADLLMSHAYDILTSDVIDAKHIGRGVIDGVECEHLGFRGHDTDWQIWIEKGSRPIPRKYVITSKSVTGAPQYTLRVKEWRTDAQGDTFLFKAPQGAKKVAVEALEGINEVPPGVITVGGQK